MCVYLHTKLQLSSITRTTFRQVGEYFYPSFPTANRVTKKPTQIKVKTSLEEYTCDRNIFSFLKTNF